MRWFAIFNISSVLLAEAFLQAKQAYTQENPVFRSLLIPFVLTQQMFTIVFVVASSHAEAWGWSGVTGTDGPPPTLKELTI